VRRAFLDRPRLVEKAVGFCGLWTDESSFQAWHRSEAHHQSHALMPPGLKLDATLTSLTIGHSIVDPAGIQTVSDALEGRTVGLSQWLMESDSVFAVLLASDGSIRARSKAAYRVFLSEIVWLPESDITRNRNWCVRSESRQAIDLTTTSVKSTSWERLSRAPKILCLMYCLGKQAIHPKCGWLPRMWFCNFFSPYSTTPLEGRHGFEPILPTHRANRW